MDIQPGGNVSHDEVQLMCPEVAIDLEGALVP